MSEVPLYTEIENGTPHAPPPGCFLGGLRRRRDTHLRNVKRFRGGLVFNAYRLLYHSTLGLRVIKKKRRRRRHAPLLPPERLVTLPSEHPRFMLGINLFLSRRWHAYLLWPLGFRVWDLGFGIWGFGLRV